MPELDLLNSKKILKEFTPETYILVQRHFPIGGIETLICRLANHLSALGHCVIVCARPGEMMYSLNSSVKFISFSNMSSIWSNLKSEISSFQPKVKIITFNPIGIIACVKVKRKLEKLNYQVDFFSGVYHPRAYFWPADSYFTKKIYKFFFFSLPVSSITFMNKDCLKAHEDHWQIDLGKYTVWKLPIENRPVKWSVRGSSDKIVQIVSVGRLVKWKAYNLGIINAARRLKDAGIKFQWHIWGSGPMAVDLRRYIDELDLQDTVFLKGSLNYSDYENVVKQADIFVGMGTSALEASMLGVPTILAIDKVADSTCGYLYNAPGACVGEAFEGMSLFKFDEYIIRHVNMDDNELVDVSAKCRASAIEKSSNTEEIAGAFSASEYQKIGIFTNIAADIYIRYYDFRQELSRMRVSWQK